MKNLFSSFLQKKNFFFIIIIIHKKRSDINFYSKNLFISFFEIFQSEQTPIEMQSKSKFPFLREKSFPLLKIQS